MAFYPLEKLHRLIDGYKKVFNIQGKEYMLIHDGDQTHLIDNVCPHMDAPLTYSSIKNGVIRCPVHGLEFNLQDGQALRGVIGPLTKHRVTYEGDQIGVELP